MYRQQLSGIFVGSLSNLKNIMITKISADELEKRSDMLKLQDVFQSASPIDRISDCHFIECIDGSIKTKLYTSQINETLDEMIETTESEEMNVTVEQMVAVRLMESEMILQLFMALVLEIDGEDVSLHYMSHSRTLYHWPDNEDISWQEDIICIMPPPKYLNSRNQLEFPKDALEHAKQCTLNRDCVKKFNLHNCFTQQVKGNSAQRQMGRFVQ